MAPGRETLLDKLISLVVTDWLVPAFSDAPLVAPVSPFEPVVSLAIIFAGVSSLSHSWVLAEMAGLDELDKLDDCESAAPANFPWPAPGCGVIFGALAAGRLLCTAANSSRNSCML